MDIKNPVYAQAASAVGFIALAKALNVMFKAFYVYQLSPEQDAAINTVIDTAIPIIAVILGAWWASRKVTPLAAPRDVDGTTLSRPDNAPAIEEAVKIEKAHEQALKINQNVDKPVDDRRIKR